MEEAVEQIVAEALSDFLPIVLSFLLSNIGWLLLAALALVLLLVLAGWVVKHKLVSGWWRRTIDKYNEAAAQLNALMTSDSFRALEQGFVQGKTERALSQLEERLHALHRKSEQLHGQLGDKSVSFFSLFGPLLRIARLERSVRDFARQVELLAHDLSGVARTEKDAVQAVRQAGAKLAAASQKIAELKERTGYPLDELNRELERVTASLRQAEQAAAFDTVRALSELAPLHHSIDALTRRTEELQKQLAIFDEMRKRIRRQSEPLASAGADAAAALGRIDPIVREVERALGAGKAVDLRSAAAEIELLVREATDAAEAHRSGRKQDE